MALTNNLLCNLINKKSTRNKTNTIRNLINDHNLVTCMLTEICLSNNVSDYSKINEMTPGSHNFYHVMRKKRWWSVNLCQKSVQSIYTEPKCVQYI